MENKITPEMLEKAKQAKTVEELIALAKENGTELTEESAKAYFDQLHKTGELADEELDNVVGGCDDEPTDPRVEVSIGKRRCIYYACGICEMKAGACDHRALDDCTCGNCLHIRYKDNGTVVCNSLNVRDASDARSVLA